MATLFCDNFNFNGKNMSSFGFITATFDSDETTSVKDIALAKTLNTERIGTNPVNYLYNVSYGDPLVFSATLLKERGEELTMTEFRQVVKWLTVDDYKRLVIDNKKCKDCYFMCVVSNIQVYDNGEFPIGVCCEFTCDAPYGWTDWLFTPTANPVSIDIDTDDVLNPIKPKFHLKIEAAGDVTLSNETTGETMVLKDLLEQEDCVVDCERCILTSSITNRNLYKSFNRKWISFVDGVNKFSFSGVPTITISARIPREVGY